MKSYRSLNKNFTKDNIINLGCIHVYHARFECAYPNGADGCKESDNNEHVYNKNITITEKPCKNWNISGNQTADQKPYAQIVDNKAGCRNPNNAQVPWCYISDETNETEEWFEVCSGMFLFFECSSHTLIFTNRPPSTNTSRS